MMHKLKLSGVLTAPGFKNFFDGKIFEIIGRRILFFKSQATLDGPRIGYLCFSFTLGMKVMLLMRDHKFRNLNFAQSIICTCLYVLFAVAFAKAMILNIWSSLFEAQRLQYMN